MLKPRKERQMKQMKNDTGLLVCGKKEEGVKGIDDQEYERERER